MIIHIYFIWFNCSRTFFGDGTYQLEFNYAGKNLSIEFKKFNVEVEI